MSGTYAGLEATARPGPTRPVGPRAAGRAVGTWPTLARAGSPSRGWGRVVEGAGGCIWLASGAS